MKLATARVLSGEREFLERLVDQQDDLAQREVYSDWLEEHGDRSRATALRATTLFLKTGQAAGLEKKLPERDAVWSQLIGLDVLRTMALEDKVHHAACAEWLNMGTPALALDTVRYRGKSKSLSKAWGEPDLPRNAAWPTGRECRFWYRSTPEGVDLDQPCKFALQIDLSELKPALAARSWIGAGVLWVFSFAEFDSAHTGYVFRFGENRGLARRAHPDGGESNSMSPPHELHLREYLAFPEIESVHKRLSRKAQKEIPINDWKRVGNKIIYPRGMRQFTDHGREINGLFGPMQSTSGSPEVPNEKWERLLVFDHDHDNPVRFHTIVERSRAARGDFSRTRLAWMDLQ